MDTTIPTICAAPLRRSAERPRNVRATAPKKSYEITKPKAKDQQNQGRRGWDWFSEGKGHTFESCRARQQVQGLNALSAPLNQEAVRGMSAEWVGLVF